MGSTLPIFALGALFLLKLISSAHFYEVNNISPFFSFLAPALTKCIIICSLWCNSPSATQAALLNPGPDIVVCDEGHRIKNAHATISKALKKIKTRSVFNVQFILPTYPNS